MKKGKPWAPTGAVPGFAQRNPQGRPKEVVKEGLSEYFIYTIEGTETIPNGWSKRMRSLEADDRPLENSVPLSRAGVRPATGADVPAGQRKESKLGTTPLPDGMVRVFRRNGRDGLSFLVAHRSSTCPSATRSS